MKAAEKPATVSRYNTLIDSSPIRQKFSALQPLKYRCYFIAFRSTRGFLQHFTDFQIQSHPGNHNVPRPETNTNPFTLTVNKSWVGLETHCDFKTNFGAIQEFVPANEIEARNGTTEVGQLRSQIEGR